MSLNHKEIDLILSELELSGTFVQDIVQPSYDSIALYTYKPGEPKTVFIMINRIDPSEGARSDALRNTPFAEEHPVHKFPVIHSVTPPFPGVARTPTGL